MGSGSDTYALKRFARTAIRNMAVAVTVYTQLRRFQKEYHLAGTTFKEVSIIANKLYMEGVLSAPPTKAQCWMAIEMHHREIKFGETDIDHNEIECWADVMLDARDRPKEKEEE